MDWGPESKGTEATKARTGINRDYWKQGEQEAQGRIGGKAKLEMTGTRGTTGSTGRSGDEATTGRATGIQVFQGTRRSSAGHVEQVTTEQARHNRKSQGVTEMTDRGTRESGAAGDDQEATGSRALRRRRTTREQEAPQEPQGQQGSQGVTGDDGSRAHRE